MAFALEVAAGVPVRAPEIDMIIDVVDKQGQVRRAD